MKSNSKKIPQDLIDQDPNKFVKWFTETIKSNFSNEVDLFMEIRKKEHHRSSLARLLTKKALINSRNISFHFNEQNNI